MSSRGCPCHYNLGLAFHKAARLEEAVAAYRRGGALQPDLVEAHYNAGNVLRQLRRVHEAAVSYRQAVATRPDFVEAHANLGTTLAELGCAEEGSPPNEHELPLRLGWLEMPVGCSVLPRGRGSPIRGPARPGAGHDHLLLQDLQPGRVDAETIGTARRMKSLSSTGDRYRLASCRYEFRFRTE